MEKPKRKRSSKKEEVVIDTTITNPVEQIKSIFLSKTFWVNIIALVAFLIQKKYGFIVNEDVQLQALTIVNILLRSITKEAVTWKRNKNGNT